MIHDLLPSLRVIEIPLTTEFRGITVREVALFESSNGLVEFSPFIEYDDHESSRWLQCTLEAASKKEFPALRSDIPLNGTIPATNSPEVLDQLLTKFSAVSTFKVKVGADLEADIERIKYVKSARPDAKVRIDVNGTWSVETAAHYLQSIVKQVVEIEYVEQPCASVEELKELKQLISIPIAADEVIRKAADPLKVDLTGAADILVIKVQPLGGIESALAIAEHHGLPVVVSSALESPVGLAYGVRLAQSVKSLNFACGLATENLFAGPGRDVSAERFQWWKNRIMRCAELIESK